MENYHKGNAAMVDELSEIAVEVREFECAAGLVALESVSFPSIGCICLVVIIVEFLLVVLEKP